MRALAIFLETIHDMDGFEAYRSKVMPTIEAFGGRFLVRGGKWTTLEGAWSHERMAVLEFPSREAAEGWYNSPAYQAIVHDRLNNATCHALIVDAAY
ncbi:DUF1330 domain-containing protein [Albidovulum sediminicola]|uniref:DUF1330 domain-containing protein n=1 Tax=Albidovulum sediminicola TaxID=2984331 RepID=A0ABT2Z0W7_9RHOB|nr:DUF1330 domain-containing protein [Defluviimonas sp. WL0075]MCV2864789.1 DUF1330 domain-containing protein [Defluviimonas sp. WL0075]